MAFIPAAVFAQCKRRAITQSKKLSSLLPLVRLRLLVSFSGFPLFAQLITPRLCR